MACVYTYVIFLTFFGPERRGRRFGVEHDSDMVDAAGREALYRATGRGEETRDSSDADGVHGEKV